MKHLNILVLLTFLVSMLAPTAGNIEVNKKYTYASEEYNEVLHFRDILEPTASNHSILGSVVFWKQAS